VIQKFSNILDGDPVEIGAYYLNNSRIRAMNRLLVEERMSNQFAKSLSLVKETPPVNHLDILFQAQRVVDARVSIKHVLMQHVIDKRLVVLRIRVVV